MTELQTAQFMRGFNRSYCTGSPAKLAITAGMRGAAAVIIHTLPDSPGRDQALFRLREALDHALAEADSMPQAPFVSEPLPNTIRLKKVTHAKGS